MNSAELARRFNLPNVLRFEDAPGGLVRAVVSSQAAEAEIYLGAHVARWTPRGSGPSCFSVPRACLRLEWRSAVEYRLSFRGSAHARRASPVQLMALRVSQSGRSTEQGCATTETWRSSWPLRRMTRLVPSAIASSPAFPCDCRLQSANLVGGS